jgi:polyisoprenyl-phosphate glycosyltransferase
MSGEASIADISVLIPCLNEAENVAAITGAIAGELQKAGVSYDITFIDNGSTDGTIDLIKGLCARDPQVRLIVNNRNFGQMRSPTHGVYQVNGRAVIGISADFQDPPELIPQLIDHWRAGAPIVLGVRQSEKTTLILRVIRAIGYGFFARFGDYPVIPGATGFGLYDRRVIDCLRQWRDPEPFFRGMLVESGFPITTIPYHRPRRAGGRTKNNIASLFSFAISGLASSSKKLLRLPIYVALLMAAATVVTSICVAIATILGRGSWTLAVLVGLEILFTLLFLFVGLIGEQVRIIADIVRNVPLVTEKERVNFPPA